MWRLARSLEQLRAQVNAAYPGRDKSSDGTLGDARHAASKSEHNPDANGVVRALDITNDPAHGLNARALAEAIVASRDPRILYVISNAQINSSVKEPWKWRPYNGENAHRQHVHISVVSDPNLYDDVRPWALPGKASVKPPSKPKRFTNITATVFSGPQDKLDNSISGYGGRTDHTKPGVALPFKFQGKRPKVRVFYGGKSVVCDIVDVGPWNTNDDYWATSHGRPQAETGRDRRGRKTNLAGIDLTPAAARALGLPFLWKGNVDWEFVEDKAPSNIVIGAGTVGGVGTGTVGANEAQKAGWHPVAIGAVFVGCIVAGIVAAIIIKRLLQKD